MDPFSNDNIVSFAIATIAGALVGAAALWIVQRLRLSNFTQLANDLIRKAQYDSDSIRINAENAAKQLKTEQQHEYEQQWQRERQCLRIEEERIKTREDKLDSRMSQAEKKLVDVEKREALLITKKDEIDAEKAKLNAAQAKVICQLEHVSGLSAKEARQQLEQEMISSVKRDMASLINKTIAEAEADAERQASGIIATAINRLAVRCVSESTVNTIPLPNEEMKGRIIGREGRNVRALERATGVNIIVDDTPGAIVISGFDPIRMQVAKIAISELIHDGRVHPTRIEEAVEKAKTQIDRLVRHHGEDAAVRAGVRNLHPELIILLGKLKFRYSYGQNILEHSLEVSHLMGIMAAELGLDIDLAKRIGLLHDFGKAVSHEIEGSHAIIGHDLALRYGETKEVANGIGCHHEEIEAITVEGSLCSAADAISASRQGARSEFVEEYIKRLRRLEEIAETFPGIEKAYAMQAGREVRVVVHPDQVDDDGVVLLSRDIAKKIESELRYPGKIKVTVIREKRTVQFAF